MLALVITLVVPLQVLAETGTINTVAGNGVATHAGDGGPAKTASLYHPVRVAFVEVNKGILRAGDMLISDSANSALRRVAVDTKIITTLIQRSCLVQGLALSADGDVYFGEHCGAPGSHVYKYDPAAETLTLIASVAAPYSLAFDAAGNLFIASSNDNQIFKIAAGSSSLTVFAGTGAKSYSGDGGPATAAALNDPACAVPDSLGNVYICDNGNNVIRKVEAGTDTITTVFGGSATPTQLQSPNYVLIKNLDSVFISDTGASDTNDGHHRILHWVPSSGAVTVIAGTGSYGFSGDGGLATAAQLNNPAGLAFGPEGDLLATGLTRCITGLTRNPSLAKEMTVPFGPFAAVFLDFSLLGASTPGLGTTPPGPSPMHSGRAG